MRTITLVQPETKQLTKDDKYYLAISSTSLCVIVKRNNDWCLVEYIIVGEDRDAYIVEFDNLDDMLDIISIVKSVINQNGSINLERHFNLQY
jgi:hypothetical protein